MRSASIILGSLAALAMPACSVLFDGTRLMRESANDSDAGVDMLQSSEASAMPSDEGGSDAATRPCDHEHLLCSDFDRGRGLEGEFAGWNLRFGPLTFTAVHFSAPQGLLGTLGRDRGSAFLQREFPAPGLTGIRVSLAVSFVKTSSEVSILELYDATSPSPSVRLLVDPSRVRVVFANGQLGPFDLPARSSSWTSIELAIFPDDGGEVELWIDDGPIEEIARPVGKLQPFQALKVGLMNAANVEAIFDDIVVDTID